ncbi:unnamed protein product [Cuscuta epithymum]|uniref:Uncharacterized protein n=1 Tax=Cuscuta epithymum TaxID=186058 RepID=A0AAV0EWT8_9ASTE|nr:unnamed protein product [Cuscuta epithymum]
MEGSFTLDVAVVAVEIIGVILWMVTISVAYSILVKSEKDEYDCEEVLLRHDDAHYKVLPVMFTVGVAHFYVNTRAFTRAACCCLRIAYVVGFMLILIGLLLKSSFEPTQGVIGHVVVSVAGVFNILANAYIWNKALRSPFNSLGDSEDH